MNKPSAILTIILLLCTSNLLLTAQSQRQPSETGPSQPSGVIESQPSDQYGQRVEQVEEVQSEVKDGILVHKGKNSAYKLWFNVRIQGDGAVSFGGPDYTSRYLGGQENPNHIGNGMNLRRTRFAVKGQLDKNWYGEFDTDWSSGVCEVKDALIEYTGVPGLSLKVGNFKESFSIQRNTTSRYLMFMERSMATYLAPSRHLGFNATYYRDWFWVAAGVFGPEIKGAEEQTAMEDNNKDFGRNVGMSYTGKIVFRPFMDKDKSLHIGGAFSYRDPKTSSTDAYGAARYSTRNSTSVNRKKYLDTDVMPGMDHELAWTVELAGHYKGLRYEAALIERGAYFNRAVNDIDAQWAKGFYVQASYALFGGRQNYDAKGAKYTRMTNFKKWGMLEIAARYDYLDLNTGKYFGGSGESYAIGINYYPTQNVKFMLNYQYNNNDRYANGKGKLYVGYDEAGKPTADYTKVSTANGKAGVDYHMLALRCQIAF